MENAITRSAGRTLLRQGPVRSALIAALMLSVAACATTGTPGGATPASGSKSDTKAEKPAALRPGQDPAASKAFASTYAPLPRADFAIVGTTAYTGTGTRIENATLVVRDGKIVSLTEGGAVPEGVARVDGKGKFITPGIVDAHSHLGVYASPGVSAHSDGNEATNPVTSEVWAEHSLWPQDPGFNRAREGGVTTLHILPGSANLIGGRSVTVKNVPALSVMGMKFPDAPHGLKMACGENPKRVYGGRGRAPSTRMANVAGYRAAWIDAADYARKWDAYYAKVEKGEKADAPKRDLRLDTLAGVLRGEILIQNHCYRADEMLVMLEIAKEFNYKITMFHHGSEAYKLARELKAHDACVATWSGWWGFKMESLDGIEENAGIVDAAGACAVIHSDDAVLTQRLNQEAVAALSAARRAGINIAPAQAIRWITLNPAKAIGIDKVTGSLEAGKNADVVIWNADPLSVYARTERVYIDGAVVYDRKDPRYQPKSDFELGQPGQGAF